MLSIRSSDLIHLRAESLCPFWNYWDVSLRRREARAESEKNWCKNGLLWNSKCGIYGYNVLHFFRLKFSCFLKYVHVLILIDIFGKTKSISPWQMRVLGCRLSGIKHRAGISEVCKMLKCVINEMEGKRSDWWHIMKSNCWRSAFLWHGWGFFRHCDQKTLSLF